MVVVVDTCGGVAVVDDDGDGVGAAAGGCGIKSGVVVDGDGSGVGGGSTAGGLRVVEAGCDAPNVFALVGVPFFAVGVDPFQLGGPNPTRTERSSPKHR